MNQTRPLTKTRIASVELVQPELIHVRVNDGIVVGAMDMTEIVQARLHLQEGKPCASLVEWPSNAEFNLSYLHQDHYNGRDAKELTTAVAMVARTELQERLLGLFFNYHAQPFATGVFRDRGLAMQWLDSCARRVA